MSLAPLVARTSSGELQIGSSRAVIDTREQAHWAAPDFMDTLNGGICSEEEKGIKENGGKEACNELTDCEMRSMSGYELASAGPKERGGRRSSRKMCVYARVGEVQKCLDAAMDDRLGKPDDLAALRRMPARWLPGAAAGSPSSAAAVAEPLFDLSRIGGANDPAARQILQFFVQTCNEDMASLREAVVTGEADLACHMAHRMLGASQMIGANAVERLCLRVQESARAEDWVDVRAALQELEFAHEQLRRAMPGK